MSLECESEYTTSYFRCIDPIENLKINVKLKPVKHLFIPLPQFDVDQSPGAVPIFESDNQEVEEYTFEWQEKVLSKKELKQLKDSALKKKIQEKYPGKISTDKISKKNYPQRLFTYVDVDNFNPEIEPFNKGRKILNKPCLTTQKFKNFGNIPKAKIINYYPSNDFKNECDVGSNKYIQSMYIMIDLGTNNGENEKENSHEILCILHYNTYSNLLEMTPSFSKSQMKPYMIGMNSQDARNSYYYWLNHASTDISAYSLRKEIGIMTKVLNHQEELKKLLIGSDFTVGQSDHLYVTILGEIVSAENFEYDYLYVNYYVKIPEGWESNEPECLSGSTQVSKQNSQGVAHFSHLFEIVLHVELQSFEGHALSPPEIIFEISSVDKYNRYRNEGYTYTWVPESPGMYQYDLKCWRASDRKIKSRLERFFIGGGPELDDLSYVGLSNTQRAELMSRFGFETYPSGQLNLKMNVIHQSEVLKRKDVVNEVVLRQDAQGKPDTEGLLSSVNTVLEAFRKARARMLEARKGLEPEINGITRDVQNGPAKKSYFRNRKTNPIDD